MSMSGVCCKTEAVDEICGDMNWATMRSLTRWAFTLIKVELVGQLNVGVLGLSSSHETEAFGKNLVSIGETTCCVDAGT